MSWFNGAAIDVNSMHFLIHAVIEDLWKLKINARSQGMCSISHLLELLHWQEHLLIAGGERRCCCQQKAREGICKQFHGKLSYFWSACTKEAPPIRFRHGLFRANYEQKINTYLRNDNLWHVLGSWCIKSSPNRVKRMNASKKSPACVLRWSVQKVSQNHYAVSATLDGREYDFVGNFKSITDANRAGRRYASDLLHNSVSGGRLSLRYRLSQKPVHK